MYKNQLELIANGLLEHNGIKPDYSNRDFMNAVIIFQTALMDKMFDMQESEKISEDDSVKMAESCGLALRKLIHTYTGLDMHNVDEFI